MNTPKINKTAKALLTVVIMVIGFVQVSASVITHPVKSAGAQVVIPGEGGDDPSDAF